MANILETEMRNSFVTNEDVVYIRLVVNKQGGYGIKTLCDALVDVKGGPNLAFEYKDHRAKALFPFSRLEDSQVEGLKKLKFCGRDSYLVLSYRSWPRPPLLLTGKTAAEKKKLQGRRAFALTITQVIEGMEEMDQKSGSLSPPSGWRPMALNCPRFALLERVKPLFPPGM